MITQKQESQILEARIKWFVYTFVVNKETDHEVNDGERNGRENYLKRQNVWANRNDFRNY